MNMKASLVLTTINDSQVLDTYFNNFSKYGHLQDVIVYTIADRKTPKEAFDRWEYLKEKGMNIVCPTIQEQEDFLTHIDFNLIPYNSDNRRNIGYLMSALNSDIDFTMSIDDDNYCLQDYDYFLESSVVCSGKQNNVWTINSKNGWYNICSHLELSDSYPRGFPYYARVPESISFQKENIEVHINAGLWLGDPDVNAMTWLSCPKRAENFDGSSVILGKNTWTPINTQNTSLRREALASYYFFKMEYLLNGQWIDRFGDIFSGYFSQACTKHLGGSVRIGTPLVDHRRNKHDYLNDAKQEMSCICLLEELLPWLTQVKLEGATYSETYNCLSELLEQKIETMNWDESIRRYFHHIGLYMRRWTACLK